MIENCKVRKEINDMKESNEIKELKDEMIEAVSKETADVEDMPVEKAETHKSASESMAATASNYDNEVKDEVPVYYQASEAKTKKTDNWGGKGVTRKFLIVSLVLTMLLNAALMAGISALFGRHGFKDKSRFSDNENGRPNIEQFNDAWGNDGGRSKNGGGRMMQPGMPGDNSQGSNNNAAPGNNQNAAPDSNQNAAPETNQNNNQNNTQNNAQTQGTSVEI